MAKHKCPPWGDRFGEGPIERGRFRRGDRLHEEAVEKEAVAELDRRITRLAEHYGAKTDRELLVAVLREVDPAFTIKSKAITSARWQGREAEPFVKLVNAIRYADCHSKKPLPWKYVVRHLESMNYGVHTDEAKLRADYRIAVTYMDELDAEAWQEQLRGPDGLALVDLVEDMACPDGGSEIDWPRVLEELHPGDHRMTVEKLRARYESVLKYWEELYAGPIRKKQEILT